MLPVGLFDMDFPFMSIPPGTRSPPTSSLAKFSARLPPLEDIEDNIDNGKNTASGAEDIDDDMQYEPWNITEFDYDRLCNEIHSFSTILPPGYSIPSRDTLTRYLEIYIVCAQKFLPFIHPATFSLKDKDVALVLAVSAIASLYRFDQPKSYELYSMAKAIALDKVRREELWVASNLLSGEIEAAPNCRDDLRTTQTLVLLILFASWADKSVAPDALSMASHLAMRVRRSGISNSDKMPPGIDWYSWVAVGEKRRTLLSAYVLFNLHSIAFDIPPLILNHEIGLCLPGYGDRWQATSEEQWRRATQQDEYHFQDALRFLFEGERSPKGAGVSSFSNYLLMHGVLQQIYIDRHATGSLRPETLRTYGTALSAWQASWERTDESSLDPLSPKGPLGLTATALLRLAYIRLNSNVSPCQGLLTRNLRRMTGKNRHMSRSSYISKAVLQAAHALSIPVRLGVEYVARSKPPIWTIENSLCSLECALLLRDWLEMISVAAQSHRTAGLSKVETKLLGIITGIIKETPFAETLDFPGDDASRYQRMASTLCKLWAQIFQGVHILEIDNTIGAGLQLLADST